MNESSRIAGGEVMGACDMRPGFYRQSPQLSDDSGGTIKRIDRMVRRLVPDSEVATGGDCGESYSAPIQS